MNQKIVGIIPLIAAMMFVAVFAVGDNQVAAATDSQTATVTVNQNIALTVGDTTFGDLDPGATGASSSNFDIANTGNVKSDVYVKSDASAFTSTAPVTDTIGIDEANYKIVGQSGDVAISAAAAAKVYDDLATARTGTNVFTTHQLIDIPAGAEDGDYSISLTYTAVKHGAASP